MGSACLFFAIRPKTALLGDINAELVRTFATVAKKPAGVHAVLSKLPRRKRDYLTLRKSNPAGMANVAAAARFIFLNRFCFNGLYRTNRLGEFNVPYAADGTGELPTKESLVSIARALRKSEIHCSDFELLLKKAEPGDFVYLDPPFAVANRRVFRQYSPSEFGTSELKRLSKCLDDLERRHVAFLVSYAYCEESLALSAKWNRRKLFVHRNIAGFAQYRRRAAELLIWNDAMSPS